MDFTSLFNRNRIRNMFDNSQPDDSYMNFGGLDPNRSGPYNIDQEPISNEELINSFNGLAPYPESKAPEMPPQFRPEDQFEYQPETSANARFNALMNEYPEKPKAGLGRKISAVALGTLADAFGSGGGQQAFGGVMYPGYEDKMKSWKDRITPAQQAADNERLANTQERMFAQNTRTNELAIRRQEELERRNRETELINIRKLEDQQKRTEILRFKQDNPTWKFVTERGGNVFAVNPIDPTKKIDTGIASGMLSDLDKINLQLDAAITRIEASGDVQSDLINQRGAIEDKQIIARGEQARTTKATPSGSSSSTSMLPSQQKVALENRVKQLKIDKPEWADFVTVDANTGDIEIVKPGTSWWSGKPTGPDQKTYDEIRNYLLQSIKPPATTVTRTTTPTNQNQSVTVNPNLSNVNIHKVGDKKTFPNGKIGIWDGKGWVAQ